MARKILAVVKRKGRPPAPRGFRSRNNSLVKNAGKKISSGPKAEFPRISVFQSRTARRRNYCGSSLLQLRRARVPNPIRKYGPIDKNKNVLPPRAGRAAPALRRGPAILVLRRSKSKRARRPPND